MRENFRREIRREKVGQNGPFYTTDNNVDIIESTLAPMNDYFDSFKKIL